MTGSGSTRRSVLRAGAAALLIGSGFAGPLMAANVAIPKGPMRLSRSVTRSLRDGAAIIVKRSWQVDFAPQARGYSITGSQIDVSVETPPALAALAAVEEGRSTADMFPILLSADGTIMAAGTATSAESLGVAIARANSLIKSRDASDPAKADYRKFVADLQKAGGTMLDQMPGDLFFPSTEPLREVRQIRLSNGMTGEFELGWEATVHPGTQLLASARREVITRIGQSERLSTEAWALSKM